MMNLEFLPEGIAFSFMNSSSTLLVQGSLTAALLPSYFCEIPCIIGLKTSSCHKMFKLLPEQSLLTLSHDPMAAKAVLEVQCENIIEASERTKNSKLQRQTSVRKKQRLVFPIFNVDQQALEVKPWPNPRTIKLPTADYFDLFSTLKQEEIEDFTLMMSDKYLRLITPQRTDEPGLDIEWEDLGSAGEKNALTQLMQSRKGPRKDLVRVPLSRKLMISNEPLKNLGEALTLRVSVVRNEKTGVDEPMPLILAVKTEYGMITAHVAPRIEDN